MAKSQLAPPPETQEPSSGVHLRAEARASEWREAIAKADGTISPMVDALLSAYEAVERRSRVFAEAALAARVVVDRLSLAVHVVDGDAVLFANEAGRALVREGVLRETTQGLVATAFESQDRFAAAVEEARNSVDGCCPFVLVRDRGDRLLGMALPAGRSLPGGVVVVIGDPETETRADAGVFAEHFGLTPTEAQVARCLAVGHSSTETADTLGITVATVRTHMKRVRKKLGTHRQVDALRILVTGPVLLR